MPSLVVLLLFAVLGAATAGALVLLSRRIKRRLQMMEAHEAERFSHLEGRIDELATSNLEIATRQDMRSDALTHRLEILEPRQQADHLLRLIEMSHRRGELTPKRAQELENTVLSWRDEIEAKP